jgi:hypothetical protein
MRGGQDREKAQELVSEFKTGHEHKRTLNADQTLSTTSKK